MTQILFLYRVQDSQSPNSILSSQVARQRTTSATANANSGTPIPSLTGNSNVTAQVLYIYICWSTTVFILHDNWLDKTSNYSSFQVNSLNNQSPSSTSLFHHRSNVSPFSTPANVQTTVNASSYVLDMPTGESPSNLSANGN